jgi:hypothetical protein
LAALRAGIGFDGRGESDREALGDRGNSSGFFDEADDGCDDEGETGDADRSILAGVFVSRGVVGIDARAMLSDSPLSLLFPMLSLMMAQYRFS